MKDEDVRKIRNKDVRKKIYDEKKKEKKQAKLKRRIERKEALKRGEEVEKGHTRTIENTKEWIGDEEGDERTRPAQVKVDDETGEVDVNLGVLADLFRGGNHKNARANSRESASNSGEIGDQSGSSDDSDDEDADENNDYYKILITTSPAKHPSKFTTDFMNDLQGMLGGKDRVDIVPRTNERFELGKVARWAKKRAYDIMMVIGEDHARPNSLIVSFLPDGPTAHFRLTGMLHCSKVPNHAKATSHPTELVINNFSTPLGLSLAKLFSKTFLPQSLNDKLQKQGFQGRQVILVQNSRDFIFVRRYRYMFVLKEHRLGKQKKQAEPLERKGTNPDKDLEQEVIKTRFQEIGPRFCLKLRWLSRGSLGETGDERRARLQREGKWEGGKPSDVFNPEKEAIDLEGEVRHTGHDDDDLEKEALNELGLDKQDEAGNSLVNVDSNVKKAEEKEAEEKEAQEAAAAADAAVQNKRKRKKPFHPLYNPERGDSPPADVLLESEPVPLPLASGKKRKLEDEESSMLSRVGKTWHAGKGEGGIREFEKGREWKWHARMQVSRRKFFL